MTKRRIDTGRSRLGWSFFGQVFVCDQAWAYGPGLRLALIAAGASGAVASHAEGGDVPTHVPSLVRGSLVHVFAAHYHLLNGLARSNAVIVGGEETSDSNAWMTPLEAAEDLADENDRLRFDYGYAPAWGPLLDSIRPILKRYPYLAAEMDEKLVPTVVETEYELPIVGESPLYQGRKLDFRITSRVDLACVDVRTGRVFIDDHKTQSGAGDTTHSYGMSGQIALMRSIGAQRWGDRFGGVFLRRIKWTPPHRMIREPPIAAPWLATQFVQQVVHRAAHALRLADGKLPIDEYPKAMDPEVCSGKWGDCPFISKCRFGPGGT